MYIAEWLFCINLCAHLLNLCLVAMFVELCWSFGKGSISILRSTVPVPYKLRLSFMEIFSDVDFYATIYGMHIYIYIYICLAVIVFANGPGDLGSIPGRVIPKTQKMVLDASLLNTQHYKVRIKGKVEPSREGVVPSPTSWCSSYRKGSLRVTFDYGRQLYNLLSIWWVGISHEANL